MKTTTKEASKKAIKKTKETKEQPITEQNANAEPKKIESQDERAARIEACEKEMGQVLTKYNCGLTAQMIINENGAIPQVFIKAL